MKIDDYLIYEYLIDEGEYDEADSLSSYLFGDALGFILGAFLFVEILRWAIKLALIIFVIGLLLGIPKLQKRNEVFLHCYHGPRYKVRKSVGQVIRFGSTEKEAKVIGLHIDPEQGFNKVFKFANYCAGIVLIPFAFIKYIQVNKRVLEDEKNEDKK